jgi:hypothetical protein
MTTRISYSLIIGLISVLTQAARGQQSGPAQLPAATISEEPPKSPGETSESEVAANNPIAPMNAIYFQIIMRPRSTVLRGRIEVVDPRNPPLGWMSSENVHGARG